MAEAIIKTTTFSKKEYLQGEKQTSVKHEFVNGTIYAMGGASGHYIWKFVC